MKQTVSIIFLISVISISLSACAPKTQMAPGAKNTNTTTDSHLIINSKQKNS